MANELQRHKTLDRVKWFVTLIVGLALIACVIALFVKLDRQTTTTTIGGEAYSIGTIDETGEYAEGNASWRTTRRSNISCFSTTRTGPSWKRAKS